MDKSFIFGDAVKATPDGKVSGWLVRFSDGTTKDIQGEYFSKNTDFGDAVKSDVRYHHGFDKTIGDKVKAKGELKFFDEGVWIESQLDLSNKYQKAVLGLAQKGVLGWSAGTMGSLIKTEKAVNGATEILRFPLGLDASLTPIPIDPLTIPSILDYATMKSLQATGIEELLEGSNTESSIAVDNNTVITLKNGTLEIKGAGILDTARPNTKGITIMTEEKKPDATETPPVVDEKENAFKAMELQVAETTAKMKAFTDMIAQSDKLKDMGYLSPDGEKPDGTKSMGDFLVAVVNKNENRLKSVYGLKAQSEAVGPKGGYNVPEEFLPQIFEVMKSGSEIIGRVSNQIVSLPTGRYPALDQYVAVTAGVGASAFDAGMTAAARAEAGGYTETDIDFTMVEWKVNDAISGIVKVSKELSQDAPFIEALLMRMIGQVQQTKTEFFILRGNGVNQPVGILNSTALISVTTASDNVFAYADALAMLSRFKPVGGQPAWLIHPGIIPDIGIFEVGTGGAVYQANVSAPLGGLPLLGYPIIMSEHLPQANNSGDVILADLSAYVLFNLGGMYVDFSEHAFFTTGQSAWRFGQRIDGKSQLQNVITLADPQGSYTVSPFVKHHD